MCNWFSELLALFSVTDSSIQRALCNAKRLGGNAVAPAIQCGHGDFKTFAFLTQQVCLRHAAVFKNEFGCWRCADAEFLFFFAECETGCSLFHDESTDSFMSEIGVGFGKHDVNIRHTAIGNPYFIAV